MPELPREPQRSAREEALLKMDVPKKVPDDLRPEHKPTVLEWIESIDVKIADAIRTSGGRHNTPRANELRTQRDKYAEALEKLQQPPSPQKQEDVRASEKTKLTLEEEIKAELLKRFGFDIDKTDGITFEHAKKVLDAIEKLTFEADDAKTARSKELGTAEYKPHWFFGIRRAQVEKYQNINRADDKYQNLKARGDKINELRSAWCDVYDKLWHETDPEGYAREMDRLEEQAERSNRSRDGHG